MASSNILKIGEQILHDDSIVGYQYHTHQPYSSTTLNNSDEIRIPIQTQDLYTLPSQSFLYIEGKLTKSDGTNYSANVHFTNNGLAFLFDEIRYELGGVVIDRVRNPGITTTIKGYVSFSQAESKSLQNAGWRVTDDNSNPDIVDTKGNFNVCIPLKILLGFAEDYHKIIMNLRQELVLIRSNSDLNAIMQKENKNETYKVTLSKVLWKMPHVTVGDAQKLRLLKQFESNRELTIAYRSWELHEYPQLQQTKNHTWAVKSSSQIEKPRYLIFCLQKNRKNHLTTDMSHFDHCNLVNLKVYLNSDVFPYDNLNLDFDNNKYAILYDMFSQFQKSYYHKNDSDLCISPKTFKENTTLVVVDCSRQGEDILKGGAVDIRIEFQTNTTIEANTSAYCLILHDRLIKYNPLTSTVKVF